MRHFKHVFFTRFKRSVHRLVLFLFEVHRLTIYVKPNMHKNPNRKNELQKSSFYNCDSSLPNMYMPTKDEFVKNFQSTL